MRRKPFFPNRTAERQEWFHRLATQLPIVNVILGLDPVVVAARVLDALYCEYICGPWLTWARDCGPAATAAVGNLYRGLGTGNFLPPEFVPPPLPPGDATATPPIPATVPVPAGALLRLLDFIAQLKRSPNYTDTIGEQLGIIGEEDTSEHEVPEFELAVERGGGCQCVKITFKKFGRQGVVIWSRRGGGDWVMLGIDLNSPYQDERDLMVAGQPEVREYRLQFYDDDGPTGDFTEVQSVTVTP